jgi:hypothetical protein
MSADRYRFNQQASSALRHVLQAHARECDARAHGSTAQLVDAANVLDAAITELTDIIYDAAHPTDGDAAAGGQ